MDSQASPTYAFISTTSTTYHPENPFENAIIDNPELVRRRRRKTSARELEVLEMAFRECDKPSREAREGIARKTGMDGKAVQIWFQNKRQSLRRLPKQVAPTTGTLEPPKPSLLGSMLQPTQLPAMPAIIQHPNIPAVVNSAIRIPLAVKTNYGPLSPKTKNIQKPSLETTCLSICAPKRAPLKRTPSIRLGEGIGGKATVVFEETEVSSQEQIDISTKKRSKPTSKPSKVKRVRRDDPGKENIPPPQVTLRRSSREPRSADLEEIALGLVALRDGR